MSTPLPALTVAHDDPTARIRPARLRRLVRRHEDLERLIAARRSHGLPAHEQWLALVALEDQLAIDYPRAAPRWQRVWDTREPPGAHAPGRSHARCPICHPADARTPGGRAGVQR